MLFRQSLAGTVLVLAGLLASCSDGSGARVGHAAEVFHFSDLDVMVATSDLIVRASVVTVAEGRVVAEEDEQHSLRFREITLRVHEVLFGGAGADTLIVEEPGSVADPLVLNNVQPSSEGDSGYFFLVRIRGPGVEDLYRLINSQGRYLLSGGELEGSNHEDALVQQLQSLTPSELEAEIAESVERINHGEVSPLPNPCCVTPTGDGP